MQGRTGPLVQRKLGSTPRVRVAGARAALAWPRPGVERRRRLHRACSHLIEICGVLLSFSRKAHLVRGIRHVSVLRGVRFCQVAVRAVVGAGLVLLRLVGAAIPRIVCHQRTLRIGRGVVGGRGRNQDRAPGSAASPVGDTGVLPAGRAAATLPAAQSPPLPPTRASCIAAEPVKPTDVDQSISTCVSGCSLPLGFIPVSANRSGKSRFRSILLLLGCMGGPDVSPWAPTEMQKPLRPRVDEGRGFASGQRGKSIFLLPPPKKTSHHPYPQKKRVTGPNPNALTQASSPKDSRQ